MSNSIVMAQPLGAKQKILEKQFSRGEQTSRLPCMHSSLRHHSKSCTPFLTQTTRATPASSAQEIASSDGGHLGRGIWRWLPRFPPSPVTVPALTLLSYKILRAYLRFHGNQKCNIEYSLIICHLQKNYIVNIC